MDIHSDAGSQIPDKFTHPVDIIEPIEGETYTEDDVKLAFGSMLHELSFTSKPTLALECCKAVFGLNVYERKSYTDIAKAHGVTRQAVCNRCNNLAGRMGVIGGTFAKKSMARETYRLTNSQRSKTPKPTKPRKKPNNGTH